MKRASRLVAVLLSTVGVVLAIGVAPAAAAGPSWSVQRTPVGSLTRSTSASAITCVTAQFCVQLGYANTSTGVLGLVYANGTVARSPMALPSDTASPPDAELFDVACRSTTMCVAVGDYLTASNTYRAMIETWDGSGWHARSAPGTGTSLRQIACSATECLATGTHFASGFDHEYLAVLSGSGTWTEGVVHSGDAGAVTHDPTCPNAGRCFAELTDESGPAPDELVVSGSDGSWSTQSFAIPDRSQPYPFTVGRLSCVGPRCYGVATYRGLDSDNRLVAETVNLTSTGGVGKVHATAIAIPGALSAAALDLQATATSCTRTRVGTLCAAAVDVTYGGQPTAGLVRFWAGGWHARIAATPAGGTASSVRLAEVSCSGYHCAAVGTYQSGGVGRAVTQDWAPGGWRATGLGVPAGMSANDNLQLTRVSCADDGHCMADGTVRYRAHDPETLHLWTASYG